MFVSKKLRTLMQLVAVEPPAAGLAASLSGEPSQFGDVALGVVASCEPLEVFANELIEGLAHRLGLFAGALDEPLVDGQRDIHAHIICAGGLRVHAKCVRSSATSGCRARPCGPTPPSHPRTTTPSSPRPQRSDRRPPAPCRS